MLLILYVSKQTFRKLYGYITRGFLELRMRNFQGIIFIPKRTPREIFKPALVYFYYSKISLLLFSPEFLETMQSH